MHLTQPDDSQELQRCLGPGFSVDSPPIPSLADVPAKPAVSCSRARSLHVDIMSSAYWAHFTDVGKENKDPSAATIHCITNCGTVQVALGKHGKGTLWLLPHAGKFFLVIRNLYLSESCWNLLEDKHFCRHFCKSPRVKQ